MEPKERQELNAQESILAESSRKRLPWSEITDDERIERMREMIKGMSRSAQHSNEKLYGVERVINKHQHGATGEVLIPADNRYDNPLGGICSGAENAIPGGEWF